MIRENNPLNTTTTYLYGTIKPIYSKISSLNTISLQQIYTNVLKALYKAFKKWIMCETNFPCHWPRTRERSGSVLECLTQDRRVEGSSITGDTALFS